MPLEDLLDRNHQARLVWDFCCSLDLSALYDQVRSRVGGPGHPAIDPKICLALWLYATLEGVGSARALARLCAQHHAFRWLAGGVPVNHHTLADFRVAHGPRLDALLTRSVAALMAEGLVSLERTAQDGMRVRASAGSGSYRGRDALDRALEAARERVRALRAELDSDPGATSRRLAARRERAARERVEGIERALAKLPLIEARKRDPHYRGRRDAPAEASTSDAEVDMMAFPDGGRRPAWNAQLVSDAASGCILHADLVTVGDQTQLGPGVDGVVRRYGRAPAEHLVDGGHRHLATIERLARMGTTVYMPVQRPRRGVVRDPHLPLPGDTPAVAGWRVRMGTPEARAIYALRAHAAEWVNASLRNRGLAAVRVRTRPRVRAAILLQVLAHNLLRAAVLRRQRADALAS
jgi:transposase